MGRTDSTQRGLPPMMRRTSATLGNAWILVAALAGLALTVLAAPLTADETAAARKPDSKNDATPAKGGTGENPKPDDEKKDDPKRDEPDAGAPPGTFSDAATIAFINAELEKVWRENKIKPSNVASDYEWIRRAFIDVIGRIPSVLGDPNASKDDPIQRVGELPYFLARPQKTRRAETLKYLLKHPDYAKNWANIWTVWLLTRTNQPGIDRNNFYSWVADQFAMNRRFDEFVTDLVTASGKADDRSGKNKTAPATNFILSHMGELNPADKRARDGQFEMVPVTSRVTRLFLGMQTQCTQCHDHPFIDERKQSQFWGINVYFRQLERIPATIEMRNAREMSNRHYELRDNISANQEAAVYFERRNGLILKTGPMYLDGTRMPPSLAATTNRRQELAKLLVQDEYFGKAIANRMWSHFMGRGFTNPVDDFGEHNPISHPEILDRLAKDFVSSGYDLQRLITWIVGSRSYQLTSIANETNAKADAEPFFARMLVKSMSPEVLVESIFQATNAENTKATPEAQRKMREEWLRDFSVNFGDDEGNEVTFNGTVVQALLLMNGPKLNEVVRNKAPGSVLARVGMISNPRKRLDTIYLATLGRLPSAAEANFILARMGTTTGDASAPWQDVLWALLNSNEFILNH
jgi:hypothetical protein